LQIDKIRLLKYILVPVLYLKSTRSNQGRI